MPFCGESSHEISLGIGEILWGGAMTGPHSALRKRHTLYWEQYRWYQGPPLLWTEEGGLRQNIQESDLVSPLHSRSHSLSSAWPEEVTRTRLGQSCS